MPTLTAADGRWMRRALELAAKGKGRVEPNPPVGAVIVKDDKVVGEGFHERFGAPHAEVNAIAAAGEARKGGTLYVTLEPCTGLNKKTPPCCDAVIKAGLLRIVIGTRDPTQEPAAPRLEAAGMEVTTGVLEAECRKLIAPFLRLRLDGRPYVIAKWAMTADGKIATVSGDSKWISSEPARELVHRWRSEVDAVLVGIGTVRRDDPLLTCRIPGGRNPRRIILDENASLRLDSQLAQSLGEAPLTVACLHTAPAEACENISKAGATVVRLSGQNARVSLRELLQKLGAEQVTNLMVEGGGEVLSDFFQHRLIDEVRVFIAPKLVGGAAAPTPVGGTGIQLMSDAVQLADVTWAPVGDDMLLTGRLKRE